ncbi:hypothetical protein ADL04_28125 [Streptomyces sp. NRRL B-3648]|nr:hypothetical protein ADL04_28125 [Streptomyces sp. NRRL B-3648]
MELRTEASPVAAVEISVAATSAKVASPLVQVIRPSVQERNCSAPSPSQSTPLRWVSRSVAASWMAVRASHRALLAVSRCSGLAWWTRSSIALRL